MPLQALLPLPPSQPLPVQSAPPSALPFAEAARVPVKKPALKTFRPFATLLSAEMCQSLNIRYELSVSAEPSERTNSLLSLYWEGRRLAGYGTIEQFYADMALDGWQIQSIRRARSRRQLHFAVMKRVL